MQELSEESKSRIQRFKVHRARCEHLEFFLGESAAKAFHARFKSDPGGKDAEREYDRLTQSMNN